MECIVVDMCYGIVVDVTVQMQIIFQIKENSKFFFPWGLGVPQAGKNFARPPQPTAVPIFWPEHIPPPPNWVLSPKISKKLKKTTPHFYLNFEYF